MTEPPMHWTILVEFPNESLQITIDDERHIRLRSSLRLSFAARQRLAGMILDCMARYEAINSGEDTPLEVLCTLVRGGLWTNSPWSNHEHRQRDRYLVDELRAVLPPDRVWLVQVPVD